MARVRDPAGFSKLSELGSASLASYSVTRTAVEWVAIIVAAKGGTVAGITVGDCLELLEVSDALFPSTGGKGPSFYQLLHEMGIFPPGAPVTVRMFNPNFQGQLTAEQLIDRYDLACRPVRDLLVDYLRERQPGIDYTTLRGLSTVLARSGKTSRTTIPASTRCAFPLTSRQPGGSGCRPRSPARRKGRQRERGKRGGALRTT
jgi:hypothetical protein